VESERNAAQGRKRAPRTGLLVGRPRPDGRVVAREAVVPGECDLRIERAEILGRVEQRLQIGIEPLERSPVTTLPEAFDGLDRDLDLLGLAAELLNLV